MSAKRKRRVFSYEVNTFSNHARPKKLIGTYRWSVGDSDGFCFFVEAESHQRQYKSKAKIKPFRGPIITTRTEATRQAKTKAAELQSTWDVQHA